MEIGYPLLLHAAPCVVGEISRDLVQHPSRRVLSTAPSLSTTELTRDVLRSSHTGSREAHPFRWTFTGESKLPIAA